MLIGCPPGAKSIGPGYKFATWSGGNKVKVRLPTAQHAMLLGKSKCADIRHLLPIQILASTSSLSNTILLSSLKPGSHFSISVDAMYKVGAVFSLAYCKIRLKRLSILVVSDLKLKPEKSSL